MVHRPIIHINKRLVWGSGTGGTEIRVRFGKVSLDVDLFKHKETESGFGLSLAI